MAQDKAARSNWEAWLSTAGTENADGDALLLQQRFRSLYVDMLLYLEQYQKEHGQRADNVWRKAAYAVWLALPTDLRQPRFANELAHRLGLVDDDAFRKWRKSDPEIFDHAQNGVKRLIREWLPDIVWASIKSATTDGAQGFQDRRMLMQIGGVSVEKSEHTLVGDPSRPLAMRSLDELSDAELAAIAAGTR